MLMDLEDLLAKLPGLTKINGVANDFVMTDGMTDGNQCTSLISTFEFLLACDGN